MSAHHIKLHTPMLLREGPCSERLHVYTFICIQEQTSSLAKQAQHTGGLIVDMSEGSFA